MTNYASEVLDAALAAGAQAQHAYYRRRAKEVTNVDVPEWDQLPEPNKVEARASFSIGFGAAVALLKDALPGNGQGQPEVVGSNPTAQKA